MTFNSDKPLHVVIGSGALGMAVVRALKKSEATRLRLVSRRGSLSPVDGVEVVRADVSRIEEAHRVCAGAEVVYHCAQPGYTQWVELFPKLTRSLISGASAAGARLVFGDNLYMYGKVSGPMTEGCPDNPVGKKGHVRALMAKELMDAHRSGTVQVSIGRASDFFGPHVLNSVIGERFFSQGLAGKPVDVMGDPDKPHTYTFIDDFARGLVLLGQEKESMGSIWHIPSAETVTTRAFVEMVENEVGKRLRIRTVPKLVIYAMGTVNGLMRELRETLYQFEFPFVMDASKFHEKFEFQPTNHKDAISETVGWFRKIKV